MYWILGLEGYRNYIARIPRIIKRLIMMFMLLSAFIMMYEFIQTFLVWISFYITYGGDLDMLYHKINPAMPKPVNFNFVSKLYAMFFSGSLYGIYYFLKLDKNTSNIIKDKMLS